MNMDRPMFDRIDRSLEFDKDKNNNSTPFIWYNIVDGNEKIVKLTVHSVNEKQAKLRMKEICRKNNLLNINDFAYIEKELLLPSIFNKEDD